MMAENTRSSPDRRTALISIKDESLAGYGKKRPKTVEEISNDDVVLLDGSYGDYLNLGRDDSASLTFF